MISGGSVTLDVRDVAQAVRFYVETLGLKLVEEEPGGASVLVDAGEGFVLRLGSARPPRRDAPVVTLFTKVPLAEAIAIYENRGVAFTVEGTGATAVARFRDPDGNELALRPRH